MTHRLVTHLALPACVLWLALLGCVPKADGSGTWMARRAMPTPRDEMGVAVLDGRVYLAGGMTGERGNDLRTFERYDPVTDSWARLPELPTARAALRASAIGDDVYTVGGSEANRVTNAVEVFSTRAGTWRTIAPMPTPRFGLALVALRGRLYAIGGFADDGPTSIVEIFDSRTGSWSRGPALPAPRYNLAAVVLGGRIYAIGGRENDEPLRDVQVLDPAGTSWSATASLPEGMSNFAAAALNGRIHAVMHQQHFIFDPREDAWRAAEPLRVSRHGLALAAVGPTLFAVGGCTEALHDSRVNEAYALAELPARRG